MSQLAKPISTKALRARVREASGGLGRVAWCVEHNDVGWLYDDSSGSCMWCRVVETSDDECRFVPVKLTVDVESEDGES